MRLRDDLDLLDAAIGEVAGLTGIPPRHVRKDFWLTEVLRATTAEANSRGVRTIFKGGTSLSKVFGLIHRFSEDVDLLVIGHGGAGSVNRTMQALVSAADRQLGILGVLDSSTAESGRYRAVTYAYPRRPDNDRGVLLELGARGGALPHAQHSIRSLVSEYLPTVAGEAIDESAPFDIHVLSPARTLVEKLVIVHEASLRKGVERTARVAKTVRHYYDIWCLLGDDATRTALGDANTSVIAREICQHSKAIGLPGVTYPVGGFANAAAFLASSSHEQRRFYDATVSSLLWPNAVLPSFDECLARVAEHASLL